MLLPVVKVQWEALEGRQVSWMGFHLHRWPPQVSGQECLWCGPGLFHPISTPVSPFLQTAPVSLKITLLTLMTLPLTEQNMLTSSCCFHYQFVLIGLTLFSLHFFVLCWFNSVCSQPGLSCKPFMRGTCWCVESHRQLAGPGWQVWNIPAPTITFSEFVCSCSVFFLKLQSLND